MRRWKLVELCLLLLQTVDYCDGIQNEYETTVKSVIDRILDPRRYDSTIQPFTDEVTIVYINIVLLQVGPVNEFDMKFSASFIIRQQWRDERLAFDELNKSILLSYKRLKDIWVPGLYFPESREEVSYDITTPNMLLRIAPNGTVLHSQRLFVKYNCLMDLRKFPHDSQTCRMRMECYGFTIDEIMFEWSSARLTTNFQFDANMPDHKILDISTHVCNANYTTGTFACLFASVEMQRQVGFYLTQTYIPSILIVSLSWISFWIDHQAIAARISVGLLTVLTITTQSSGAMTQLPRVPYIKSIDVWMSTCLVFVFAAYMEYALVTVLSRRYRNTVTMEPHANDNTSEEDMSSVSSNGKFDKVADIRRRKFIPKHKFEMQTACENFPPRDLGVLVDQISRIAFPVTFMLFNLFYWTFYTLIM